MATQQANNFSGNYLILRPEEVNVFKLFRFLSNHEVDHKAFLDYPSGKDENKHRRCLIFMSLLAQKTLIFVAKPMASFGSKIEKWLNLLSCNRNVFVLFLNLLQGKVVVPDENSVNFLSFVGYLDKRVDLDENIKPGDSRYYSALSVMAAKLSYENEAFVEATVKDKWKMEFLGFYRCWNDYQRKKTTEAFMFRDKNQVHDIIIVSFRGTQAFDASDWCTDIDLSWYEVPGITGKIHGGFMKALGLRMKDGWPREIDGDGNGDKNSNQLAYYVIKRKLKEILKLKCNKNSKFILTGHSLGGALAILFIAVLALHEEEWLLKRLEGVYTFGQPRVGDEGFKGFMERLIEKNGLKYLRFVYCNDMIPRLPTDDSTFLFKHFGTCLYYNSCYQGQIVLEEPNKNYSSLLAGIPRLINALWELIRSFILPYTKGSNYAESWLLILIRFFGLALPGLSVHGPQDYVNATRLGPADIYESIISTHPQRNHDTIYLTSFSSLEMDNDD